MTNVVSKDRHVAVLPFPFSSHPGGLLSVVTHLAAAAPNVSFSFYSTSKSIETLFAPAKRVPGNIKPNVVSDGVLDGYVFSGNPLEAINIAAVEEEPSIKAVLKAAEAETGKRIGCVMSDAFLWFAGDLAEEMGVPWVSFWCGGANSCAAHFYTDLIRDTVGMHGIHCGPKFSTTGCLRCHPSASYSQGVKCYIMGKGGKKIYKAKAFGAHRV